MWRCECEDVRCEDSSIWRCEGVKMYDRRKWQTQLLEEPFAQTLSGKGNGAIQPIKTNVAVQPTKMQRKDSPAHTGAKQQQLGYPAHMM